MTAIVGIKQHGKVWIGGDSAGITGMSMQTRADEKVFVNGDCVIGFESCFRMGQILRYHFEVPDPAGETGMSFMVKRFIPAVRESFSENGLNSCGIFLVGYGGNLYQIQPEFQVSQVREDMFGCGCGYELVLGSLHATKKLKIKPKKRIRMALRAAEEFSAGVRGPFTILSA